MVLPLGGGGTAYSQVLICPAIAAKPSASAAAKSSAVVMSRWQYLGPASEQPGAAVPPAVAILDRSPRAPSLPGLPMTKVLIESACLNESPTAAMSGALSTAVWPSPLQSSVRVGTPSVIKSTNFCPAIIDLPTVSEPNRNAACVGVPPW